LASSPEKISSWNWELDSIKIAPSLLIPRDMLVYLQQENEKYLAFWILPLPVDISKLRRVYTCPVLVKLFFFY
jgi:hypothetical protein